MWNISTRAIVEWKYDMVQKTVSTQQLAWKGKRRWQSCASTPGTCLSLWSTCSKGTTAQASMSSDSWVKIRHGAKACFNSAVGMAGKTSLTVLCIYPWHMFVLMVNLLQRYHSPRFYVEHFDSSNSWVKIRHGAKACFNLAVGMEGKRSITVLCIYPWHMFVHMVNLLQRYHSPRFYVIHFNSSNSRVKIWHIAKACFNSAAGMEGK